MRLQKNKKQDNLRGEERKSHKSESLKEAGEVVCNEDEESCSGTATLLSQSRDPSSAPPYKESPKTVTRIFCRLYFFFFTSINYLNELL